MQALVGAFGLSARPEPLCLGVGASGGFIGFRVYLIPLMEAKMRVAVSGLGFPRHGTRNLNEAP